MNHRKSSPSAKMGKYRSQLQRNRMNHSTKVRRTWKIRSLDAPGNGAERISGLGLDSYTSVISLSCRLGISTISDPDVNPKLLDVRDNL